MSREITINGAHQHADIYESIHIKALCGHVNVARDIEIRLSSSGLLSELKTYEKHGWVICKKCIELSN